MSLTLRIDDFPGTKPEEFWKHNLENFKLFDAVLEKNGVQEYTLGVIPKYTTEEHLDWLAQNPRVRVALHGIDHDERFPNEFLQYETEDDICKKLLIAKEPLKRCNGGEVECYIPPHNVIDMKTARALVKAGFTDLMCGPGTDMKIFAEIKRSQLFGYHLLTYSHHPHFYGRTDEMMIRDNAIPEILNGAQTSAGHVLTLHWPWEWNIGLDSLDRFIGQVAPQITPRH